MLLIENTNKAICRILVDADSCPVKDIIIDLAANYGIEVIFIASMSHYSQHSQGFQWIYVDSLPQAVDMAISNLVQPGNVVVTQDYGLAAIILGKGGKVVSPRGKVFTCENIDLLLEQRNLEARIRKGGGRTKGPKALTKGDRQRFADNLIKIITAINQELPS
ncbi:MAG: YaiI/YqxD family protein [Clostridia bacterium]|nr:YaiI/YqxD family protein [Clostridia bacterium]